LAGKEKAFGNLGAPSLLVAEEPGENGEYDSTLWKYVLAAAVFGDIIVDEDGYAECELSSK
jgi:hypothetical protein